MNDPAPRPRIASTPGVLDRLARLACTVAGAPGAVVLALEAGARGGGRHGDAAASFGVVNHPGARARRRRGGVAHPAPVRGRFDEAVGELVVLDRPGRAWSEEEEAALGDVAAAAADALARPRAAAPPRRERRCSASASRGPRPRRGRSATPSWRR